MNDSNEQGLQQRAQDYVRGRLDKAAREAFEMDLVEQPALMDALEIEVALQHGLRRLPTQSASQASQRPDRRLLALAMAASLVFGIGIGAFVFRHDADEAAGSLASGLYIDQVRGVQTLPQAWAGNTPLVLEIPIQSQGPVTVTLLTPSAKRLPAQVAEPDAQGLVRIVLPAAAQVKGRWQVMIETPGLPPSTRSFDLRAPESP